VQPELSELNYRRKLHESSLTMSDLHGPDAFPKEEWAAFYKQYAEADPKEFLYRYIFCPSCNAFVGEVQWKYDYEKKRYEIQIIVEHSLRLEEYGRKGIALLEKEAEANDIDALYACTDRKNPAVGFFEHLGKKKAEEDQDTVTFLL
jgi:hypothetical protein